MDDQPDWRSLHGALYESLTSDAFLGQHPELPDDPTNAPADKDISRQFVGDRSVKQVSRDVADAYDSAMSKAGAPRQFIDVGKSELEKYAKDRTREFALDRLSKHVTNIETPYAPFIGGLIRSARSRDEKEAQAAVDRGFGDYSHYDTLAHQRAQAQTDKDRSIPMAIVHNALGLAEIGSELALTGGLGEAAAGLVGGGKLAAGAFGGIPAAGAIGQAMVRGAARLGLSGATLTALTPQHWVADEKPLHALASQMVDMTIMPGLAGTFTRGEGPYVRTVLQKVAGGLLGLEAAGDLKVAMGGEGGPAVDVAKAVATGDPEKIQAALKRALVMVAGLGVFEAVLQAPQLSKAKGMAPPPPEKMAAQVLAQLNQPPGQSQGELMQRSAQEAAAQAPTEAPARPPESPPAAPAPETAQTPPAEPVTPQGPAQGEWISPKDELANYGSDMGKTSDAVRARVQAHLDSGGTASVWHDGKEIPIAKIEGGQLRDAKGNPWGVGGLMFTKPGEKTGIELKAAPQGPQAPPAEPPAPVRVDEMRARLKAVGMNAGKWSPEKVVAEAARLKLDKFEDQPPQPQVIQPEPRPEAPPTPEPAQSVEPGRRVLDKAMEGIKAWEDASPEARDNAAAHVKEMMSKGQSLDHSVAFVKDAFETQRHTPYLNEAEKQLPQEPAQPAEAPVAPEKPAEGIDTPEDNGQALQHAIEAVRPAEGSIEAKAAEQPASLEEKLKTLTDQERVVYERRKAGETLEAIGKSLGYSGRQWAKQVEQKIIAKLGGDKTVTMAKHVLSQEKVDTQQAKPEAKLVVQTRDHAQAGMQTVKSLHDADMVEAHIADEVLPDLLRRHERGEIDLDTLTHLSAGLDRVLASSKPTKAFAAWKAENRAYATAVEGKRQPAIRAGTGEAVPGTSPGAKVVTAPERVDPVEAGLKKIADEQAQAASQGAAFSGIPLPAGLMDAIGSHIKSTWDSFRYEFRKTSGQTAPQTTDLNRPTGEALGRLMGAQTYARMAAPMYIDKVMGPGATKADRVLVGTTFQEMRHRHAREALLAKEQELWNTDRAAAVEAGKEARAIVTFVGQDNSPLKTEADYQREVNSPRFRQVLENWKREFVPEMEKNYRGAEGIEEDEPINNITQIPELPMNAKAVRTTGEATDSTVYIGQGRGNLKNVKIGKLAFAKRATLAAEAYDTDLGAIIENSLAKGVIAARKAEFYRIGHENGVIEWHKPGDRLDGAQEIPFSRPPKGTQEAERGEVAYARNEAYDETRKALAVDKATTIPVLTPFLSAVTRAALASTAEATYHTKNLLTIMMKPGMSPIDFMNNAWNVIGKDKVAAERIVELARISAMKESGYESQAYSVLKSKYSPLTWMGNILDIVDHTMRLTAEDAFERLKRTGRVEGSETNKRDFINQLGNYNKRAQGELVTILRDTGLGPFATAGTNYYVQGLRSLVMDPGVKATSTQAAIGLRAEMLARTVGVLSAVALTNYLRWGRVDGDDTVPLGAIKLADSPEGKTRYIDLTNLTGLTRGMREVGLLAMAEGARSGAQPAETRDRSVENAWHSILHPATGPGVQLLYTAATGNNTAGMKVAEEPPPGETHAWQKLKAALTNANPLYATVTGSDNPSRTSSPDEKAWKLLGPLGVKYKESTPPEVGHLKSELHNMEQRHIQEVKQARLKGMVAPKSKELAFVEHTVGQLNKLEMAFHRQDATAEDRARYRQAQRQVAEQAFEALKRVRAAQSQAAAPR